MKFHESNYKKWVKSLIMNLTIMKLNLTLKVEAPLKPTVKSFAKKKKLYVDCDYSNSYCLMIMENHMKDSIYDNIPNIENPNEFLDVGKKFTKF